MPKKTRRCGANAALRKRRERTLLRPVAAFGSQLSKIADSCAIWRGTAILAVFPHGLEAHAREIGEPILTHGLAQWATFAAEYCRISNSR